MPVQLIARFPFLPWRTEETLHGLNFFFSPLVISFTPRPQTQAYFPLSFVIISSTLLSPNFRFTTSKAAWSTFSVGLVGPNQPQLYLSRRCLICTASPLISTYDHAILTHTFQFKLLEILHALIQRQSDELENLPNLPNLLSLITLRQIVTFTAADEKYKTPSFALTSFCS